MLTILWWLLEKVDSNWGYTTPVQKRFKPGQKCKISNFQRIQDIRFQINSEVTVIEDARHDYLISNSMGEYAIVYHFELCSI